MKNELLAAALYYAEKHKFSVIPLKPGEKVPYFSWEPFQSRIASRAEITSWWSNTPQANVGIVTGKVSNLFVVDLDKYAEGYDEEKTSEYIPDSIITPAVNTPRGGQHLYFVNPEGDITIKARILPGIDYRGQGGYVVAPPSVNGTGKPYAWIDGMGLEIPLSHLPDALSNLISFKGGIIRGGNSPSRQMSSLSSNVVNYFESGRRDEDLFSTANALTKGGMPQDMIEQVLERLIVSWGEENDPKWVRAKVESAFKRAERRERNLTAEVKEWILSSSGVFLSSDVVKCLHLSSRDEQKHLSTVLRRLVTEGLIEKHGERNGCFRIPEDRADEIDIWSASVKPLPVRYPLGIEQFVNTFSKNIIVVAGSPDAGKTAFLLNFAFLNMYKHKVHYFSSEMGAEELRQRLLKFGVDINEWKRVTWKERASNFADVIEPEAVNIIDFLEIHDEFYKVGGIIKTIFDRLTTGIAVIGLQKPSGRDEGLGGQRGLEKPRLYLSMEPGRLKIVKAKNWINDQINPNGHFIEWKLGGGCNFKATGPWKKDAV